MNIPLISNKTQKQPELDIDYKLISSDKVKTFEEGVKFHLENKFTLSGGPFTDGKNFYQAVVRAKVKG